MSERPNEIAQTDDFEFAALREAKNYRQALLQEFSAYLHGSVLEVGAGIGQITGGLRQLPTISRLTAIEPDARFCEQFRATWPDQPLVQGTIADLKGEADWDAILSINVLEHIAEDGRELEAYHQKLRRQNGSLCLFVPARPEIYAPLDKDFGHFRRYTRPELRQKLSAAGFDPLTLRYYNFVGYFAWWFIYRIQKKRNFNVASVRFFDRVIFPLMHAFESRVCSPFIGQSLLVVARAK
jgi:SAM-dependent methyltransferase